VWAEHRQVANATMIDSDNVLLLRPARPTSDFEVDHSVRPQPGSSTEAKGLVVATVYYLGAPAQAGFLDFFEHELAPALSDARGSIVAYFVTESTPNDFPSLPVREGVNVLACFSLFPDRAAHGDHVDGLARSRRWHELLPALTQRLQGEPEVLKLTPTARSLLHA
jgi:hypothetical protein